MKKTKANNRALIVSLLNFYNMISEENTLKRTEDKSINKNIKEDLLNRKKSSIEKQFIKNEIIFDISKLNNSDFKKMLMYYDCSSMCPTEYLLTGMIAALSGAIGKKVYFKFTDNFYLFLNVWAVLIGPSTITKKSSSLNIVLQDIERFNQNKYNDYKAKLNEFKRGKSTNDKLIEPVREYLKFPEDSTIESLTKMLESQTRGILKAAEFGGFLKRLNKGYAGDIKETLTDLYDVPVSYEITRVTRDNVLLERPYMSILGASTIEWFRENITNSDLRAGFLARFLYSIRNNNDKDYIPFLLLKNTANIIGNHFDTKKVYDHLISIKKEVILEHTNDAEKKHIEYDWNSYQELSISNGEELSFKARLLAYSFKIAGIIALTNTREKIEVQDVEDAILIVEYYKKNVEELLNVQLNCNESQIKENKIFEIIDKSDNREIRRSALLNRSHLNSKEFDLIINSLIDKEKVSVYSKETVTKPAVVYKVVE